MPGSAFLFTLCFFLLRCDDYVIVDHRGSDENCTLNTADPCATFSQALALAEESSLTSLIIYYGNSSLDTGDNNEISAQIFNEGSSTLSNLTLIQNGSIDYPFAQLSSNARPLLTFIDVGTLSLCHLTFQVQTVGCLNISGTASLNISGCSFSVTSSESFTSPTPYIFIRDTETVTFCSYAEDSDVINTEFGSLTAVACAGIDVDNTTNFTATNVTMTGLTGSRGVGIRFGGTVTSIYITCCKFTKITSQNTTSDLGNGGALLLPSPETQDSTCCYISNSTFGDCEAYTGDGGAIFTHRSIELSFCTFTRSSTVTATMVILDGSDSITISDDNLAVSNVYLTIVASNFTADKSVSTSEASSRANRDNTKQALIHLIQCNSVNVSSASDDAGNVYACNFQNSNGVDSAGAIDCESVPNITITDAVFTQSRGKVGGAVYVHKYSGSSLTTSTVLLSGIQCNGGSTSGANRGPHLYFEEAQVVQVENCTFSTHKSTINGGSIYIGACTSYVTITDCVFNNTRAENGGAIYIDATVPNVTATNITITKCQATTAGGGIMIASNSSSSDTTVTFENVTVSSCSAEIGAGIAIAENVSTIAEQYRTVSFTSINITNNEATQFGGGLFVHKILTDSSASSFAQIHSNADTYQVTVTDVAFSNNTCSADDFSGNETYPWTVEPCGGAFAAMFNHTTSTSTSTLRLSNDETYYVYISNCSFTGNSNGAILTLNSMPVLIEDASFSSNTASYSSSSTSVDAICQSSTLHIHNVSDSDTRVILCDSSCKSSISADSTADQCYSVPASNVSANVTTMKTNIYPRMNQVAFIGSNIFPFQPILAVSLSNQAPSSDSTLLRALAHNSQIVRRGAGRNSADYVYTALVPDTSSTQIGLNLTHTLNLGGLQDDAPDIVYMFVSTDGGMTWNNNSGTEVMSITWESDNYSESDSLSTGETSAIVVAAVGVVGAVIMVVYEVIRRQRLKAENEDEETSADNENQHLMDDRSRPSYSQ